jgi:hypothetical protein
MASRERSVGLPAVALPPIPQRRPNGRKHSLRRDIQARSQRKERVAPGRASAHHLEAHGARRDMIVKSQQLRWLQPPLTVAGEPFC